MKEMYFTITGLQYRYGGEFLKPGMRVKLEKEPDNEHDKEAIMVKLKGLGKIGYVANSPYTVKGESYSAGRLYDKIPNVLTASILYVIEGSAIGMIDEDDLLYEAGESKEDPSI